MTILWGGTSRDAIAQKGGGGTGGAGGEFTITFKAAAPNTYNHQTGGGAYNDGTIGKNLDIVSSLEGGDFSCQDTVTYLAEIVTGSGLTSPHTIEINLDYLADTTGQPGLGHDQITNVAINYGQVENGDSGSGSSPGVGNFGTDSGISDDGGSTATLISQTVSNPPPLQGNGSVLTGQIQVDDLEANETVILRVDVSLTCAADTGPTGNIQGATLDATVVDDGSIISVGRQTLPFKQVGNIAGAGEPLLEFAKTVTSDLTGSDTVGSEQITATQGDTVRYLYKVSNLGSGSLFDLEIIDDNGTPGDISDDFTVDTNNILSGIGNLADIDLDADNPDLKSVSEVVLYADVPLTNSGTITNIATASGADADGGNPTILSLADTAQVIAEAANFVPPTIDLDGDDSSGATTSDFDTSYTIGGSAIKVVDADNVDTTLDTVIADSDSTQLSQAVITLTNDPSITGDAITIDGTALSAIAELAEGIASGAITADTSVANQITLSGNADIADYEAALELIEFSTTATDTTTRTVTFQVTDTNAQASNTATTNIRVSAAPTINLDYGDAPDTYGTDDTASNSSNSSDPIGASHNIIANLFLGATPPDTETNGFVDGLDDNGNATDDDDPSGTGTGNGDDEDDITLPVLIKDDTSYTIPLANITATNTTGQAATLHAWIDFDNSGTFEDTEHTSVVVSNATDGGNPVGDLVWNSITAGAAGNTYARFRLTTDSSITSTAPGGNATDGEVEDYQLAIKPGTTTFLSGQIVNDLNNNGIQEEGETGIDNVLVKLFNKQGQPVATTTTKNGGFYSFYGLPPSEYYTEIETSVDNALILSLERTPS